MSSETQTHYLNVGFDLSLRPRPRRLHRPKIERQLRELSAQALLGAQPGDAAMLTTEIPDEFLDYLDSCGVPVPRVLMHPEIDPQSRLRPFGWNAEAIELNRRHRQPVEHPPLSVIRHVNSRSFALELETELTPDAPLGALIEGRAALDAFLSGADPTASWILKSEFGNAGLANRRLHASELRPADVRFLDTLFAEDDRLVIEPWLRRERDWSVVFDVPFDSAAVRIQDTSYTRDGALIGALLHPDHPDDMPWEAELVAASERIASRLADEGYFGPVCLDAFTWRDDRGSIRLRPLVDLNCRRAMSDRAYHLVRRIAPDRLVYYRFFSRRKLDLPTGMPQARAALGELHYDRSRRSGILLLSPPRFTKLAVGLVARDRRNVHALEHEFRSRFET